MQPKSRISVCDGSEISCDNCASADYAAPVGTALNNNVVSETVSTMCQGKGVAANWKQ